MGTPEEAQQTLREAAERRRNAKRIRGGKRCGIRESEWLNNWWVNYSPRNGDDAIAEGPWEDWVALAMNILARQAKLQGLDSITVSADLAEDYE